MDTYLTIALWLALWSAGIGYALGKPKGLGVDGLVYGMLLGPLGWIIVLLKSPTPTAVARFEREVQKAREEEEEEATCRASEESSRR